MDATIRTVMWKKRDRQRFGNKGLNTTPNHELADHGDRITRCGDSVPEDGGFTITYGDPIVTCAICLERSPCLAERMRGRKAKKQRRLTHQAITEQIRKFQENGGIINKLPDQAGKRSAMVAVDGFKSSVAWRMPVE